MTLLTEDEAKERACCGPGLVAIGLLLINHVNLAAQGHDVPQPTGNTNGKCIASECMAWRKCLVETGTPTPKEVGYCGLAGNPQ